MEKSNQILELPFQLKKSSDTSIQESMVQTRFYATKILNKVALGIYELTENNKKSLRRINELCVEFGMSPLEGDF